MANEVTTTTANDVTYSAAIQLALLGVAADCAEFAPLCREFDARDEASGAVDVVRPQTFWTAADRGASVDTEFDGTQGTSLSNTVWGTDKVTGTAAEYGIQVEITDNVQEDSVRGIDIWGTVETLAMTALLLALNDDICAAFANLASSVGTSGSDLTVAQMLAAQVGIRTRGWKTPNGTAYILDNQQSDDVEAALIATNAAQAVYASAADRLLGYMPAADHGQGGGNVMAFRTSPVWATGLTDTANAGADVVGACITPSGPGNDPVATLGLVWKRLPRIEFDRDISKRTTKMVLTMRAAPFELTDGSGTKIVTDAP